MIGPGNLAEKVFSLLKGNNLQIKIYDEMGSETVDPSLGRRFFVSDPNIMVTIDEELNSIEFSKSGPVDAVVSNLQKNIKRLADEFQMNSSLKVFGKSITPKDYSYQAKKKMSENLRENMRTNSLMLSKVFHELDYAAGMTAQALTDSIPGADLNDVQLALNALEDDGKVEIISYLGRHPVYSKVVVGPSESLSESFSRMFGSKKISKQVIENVRLLVKHKKEIDENVRGSRSRQISAIFLECNGERFRFPYNHLAGARAMANHLAHGGTMSDNIGSYITESTGNLIKLQSFTRYVNNNGLINEDSSSIVENVVESIRSLRTDLKKLSGTKTYESIKSRIETYEKQVLDEDNGSDLKELFTIKRFDERVEEVLPIIGQIIKEKNQYYKRLEEAAANVIKVRPGVLAESPVVDFVNEHAKFGYKLTEFSNRILENDELAGFISKIGTKISTEGKINSFESAILNQVFENAKIYNSVEEAKELKESTELSAFFERFDNNFL